MTTRTIYVPCSQIGRYILNCIVERVGCSIGDIRKVTDVLAVPITLNQHDIVKVERILQTFDLA